MPSDTTVVLVHGAFADSSSWNGVITQLREDYRIVAAANPLRGLHSDADHLRALLDSLDGPVVLAGHSYGGSVLSQAAEAHPAVRALVFVAAFSPQPGESTAELAAKFPGGQLGPALHAVPFTAPDGTTGRDLYVRQDRFHDVFAADVPAREAESMAITQRPVTAGALEEPASRAAWTTIPSWSLVTTADLTIPAEAMRSMAQRANSRTVEIDASHAVTVSQPRAVARLIDEAARATTGRSG
ncbi:alpha/beta fold hydrolase [Kineococcus sp. SYSU DK003]|uniref:alpha/beta fold hydrolase n=1 Tax=Kineococcus sp. SYSU DK003 TaxID=3383124 RepID=UPI003D7C4617